MAISNSLDRGSTTKLVRNLSKLFSPLIKILVCIIVLLVIIMFRFSPQSQSQISLYVYMLLLRHVTHSHNVSFHFYVAGSQVYLSCNPVNDLIEMSTFLNRFKDIHKWMSQHFLQLNTNKS